jgi:RTX calcium-binding nonapeptide repeat (4 copies)/LVIVD repeat
VRSRTGLLIIPLAVATLMTLAAPSSADHATRTSEDMTALGHSPHTASADDPAETVHINSDLAFWGNMAFNGNYNGWRTIDISNPSSPVELAWYNQCNGSQGDVVVWEDILVRSWNSKVTGRSCGGQPVPPDFEGLHVFDISNLQSPQLVGSLDLPCGSHTATLAGIEGGNLILYNNISSSSGCADGTQVNDDPVGDFMDIVAVPLNNPAGINLVRREPLQGPGPAVAPNPAPRTGCHDVGVIRLDVNKAACASADTINVFDIGANGTPGGSLTDPVLLFTVTEPGVGVSGTNGRWHSATFTWDGQVIAAGWEPGGGSEAECQSTDPDADKSMFFYNANTGAKLGQWVLPRAQGADENCTIHNYNVVPMRNGRYIVVGGHYQAGTWVVDFTNPASPQAVAFSDPTSLGPGPHCTDPTTFPPGCLLGGAWSSYWYNDYVYESDITKGLNVFRVTDSALAADLTINQPFLNPQTQMEAQRCKGLPATHLGTNRRDKIRGTAEDDVVVALGGKDNVNARGGEDLVCAGGGKDGVKGKGGNDRLYGQGGGDRLNGGAAVDRCVGGPGRDRIRRCEQGRP